MSGNWQNWGNEQYGDVMYRRAIGELPEMESSKALARQVAKSLQPGDTILDAGCGAGHCLFTLRRMLGNAFDYTGIDRTATHLALARKAFASDARSHFELADIFNLPYSNGSFGIVVCTNLLQNLPRLLEPLSELTRVARKVLIVRLLCGDRTYLIRDVHDAEPELDESGEPYAFSYYNIYSIRYVAHLLKQLPNVRDFRIEPDLDFNPESLDSTVIKAQGRPEPTRMVGSMQANGYILLPWAFVTVFKE
jgi:ubiquinone/menaquinone biosynthesis C-methylase UbiE